MSKSERQIGLALDVGERRVGVARAHLAVRLASPLMTLDNPETFLGDIVHLVQQQDAAWIVIGLPRGMNGQDTAQTASAQAFGAQLRGALDAAGQDTPIYWIDEALTSAKAEAELRARGKHAQTYTKGEVDALAATYILEDFLAERA